MVYATCSILPQENEQQVEKFLTNNGEFTLLTEQTLLPHITGNDGFYIAVLERKA
jgi:16S rRNA (cytosine967-C5)-methyltransferase